MNAGKRLFSGYGKHRVPLYNSYEVIKGSLYAGEYPGAKLVSDAEKKLQALKDSGVTDIFDLTTKHEGLKPYACLLVDYSMQRHSYPIADMRIPENLAFADNIIEKIDRVIDSGGVAYVHCLGGVGRTGVIIGSYLVKYTMDYHKARWKLGRLWESCPKSKIYPWSPENNIQEGFISDYCDYCHEKYA